MSLADGRPVRHDMPTGDRCTRPVPDRSARSGERPCGTPTTRVITRIPATITVVVCPACDVVKL